MSAQLQSALKLGCQGYPKHRVCQQSITELPFNPLNCSRNSERGDGMQTSNKLTRALNSYYRIWNTTGTMNAAMTGGTASARGIISGRVVAPVMRQSAVIIQMNNGPQ